MSLQLFEKKALSRGIIGKSAPLLAEITIRKSQIDKIKQYPDAPMYHYGSYEPRAIATLAKRYTTDAENVTKRLVNVNRYIYGKVYFPVRSNRLKDIGAYIGAQWTSPIASGLQSLVWRHQWEATREHTYKEVLLTYNTEDCQALLALTSSLTTLRDSADTQTHVDFADRPKHSKSTPYGHNACKISM